MGSVMGTLVAGLEVRAVACPGGCGAVDSGRVEGSHGVVGSHCLGGCGACLCPTEYVRYGGVDPTA